MFISSHTEYQLDWNETLQLHEDLTAHICAGQADAAVQSMRAQLDNSLRLSLEAFEQKHAAAAGRT